MRVLLDTCLSKLAEEVLQAAGHDVVWGGDWREDPGDDAIIATAHREQRILVTIDKDFGELTSSEPLVITYNIGPPWTAAMRLQVEGHVNQGCDDFGRLTTLGYLDGVQVLKPNERITRTIDVTQMGLVDPGAYEIWLAYDTGGIAEGFAGGAVARILAESNRLHFEIVAPVGVDAQALKELGGRGPVRGT